MTDFKDPDFSAVDALPDPDKGVKLSAELDQLAKSIRTTAASIDTNTTGRTPEAVVNAAGEAAKGAQDLATNAAIAEQAIRMLKAAKAEWEKATVGARAADLTRAEMAVFLARKKYDDAWAAEDAAREKYNEAKTAADGAKTAAKVLETQKRLTEAQKVWDAAIETTKKANEELEARRKEFRDMKEKRKNADEAYERARTAACQKMAEIKGAPAEKEQDGGTGYGKPGAAGADAGTGYGKPGGTTNGDEIKAPYKAPAPPSTPGATPPKVETPKAEAPGSGKTGSTPDAASLAAAQALLNGQGQQQPQAQAGTPAATAPQQAQQPQAQQKPEDKKDGKQALDVSDIQRLINGEDPEKVLGGAPLGISSVVNSTGPGAPQSAPSGQNGTSFRPGVVPAGTTTGGTPAAPPPAPTTGHSVTGLNTQTDTSGRSTPAAGAYDPVKTNTSAAHGTSTAQSQAATQQAGKGAMPMMPMTPMGAMPPSGGSSGAPRTTDKDSQVLSTNGGLDHGQTAVSEAVRGGTIAQNRPDAPDSKGGKAA